MEENVALDSSKQKKFDNSIKGIKKLIKKKGSNVDNKGVVTDRIKKGRISKKKRVERGLVYLSHIPHGFYENEMSSYFKQFGVVTNARVIKSKRTGRSKGYAFVEFKEPAVAQIVAETMNNYLMGKRLIKAAYIPPEKQRRKVFRKRWNSVNNPGNNLRIKMKKAHNENKDEKGELQRARKLLSNINKTKKKLSELGINYDFFTPVDIPEALVAQVPGNEKKETINENSSEKKSKKKGKSAADVNIKVKKENVRDAKLKAEQVKKLKSKNETSKNNKDKQVEKQKKDKGVTPLEDFVEVGRHSDGDSNSSVGFDSDEFEKMLENDDDSDMPVDDNEESDESDAESDEHEELPKLKKNKTKSAPIVQMKERAKRGTERNIKPQPPQTKRKNQQTQPVADAVSKRPKFEKQTNQKGKNKQFQKKK